MCNDNSSAYPSCLNSSAWAWPSWTPEGAGWQDSIQYCLAESVMPSCSIGMSVEIMVIVIIFNAVKAFCFISSVRKRNFDPLITLGDAVSSLNRPDPLTAEFGALSAGEVCRLLPLKKRGTERLSMLRASGLSERNGRRFWYFGATRRRWYLTMFL